MIAVPAIPYSKYGNLHLASAYVLFIAGFVITFVSSALDRSLKLNVDRWISRLRLGLIALGLLGSIGFAVFFNIDYFLSSISEFIAASCMTGYICTLAHESEFFNDERKPSDTETGSLKRV
jgi:hypothetical protein